MGKVLFEINIPPSKKRSMEKVIMDMYTKPKTFKSKRDYKRKPKYGNKFMGE